MRLICKREREYQLYCGTGSKGPEQFHSRTSLTISDMQGCDSLPFFTYIYSMILASTYHSMLFRQGFELKYLAKSGQSTNLQSFSMYSNDTSIATSKQCWRRKCSYLNTLEITRTRLQRCCNGYLYKPIHTSSMPSSLSSRRCSPSGNRSSRLAQCFDR